MVGPATSTAGTPEPTLPRRRGTIASRRSGAWTGASTTSPACWHQAPARLSTAGRRWVGTCTRLVRRTPSPCYAVHRRGAGIADRVHGGRTARDGGHAGLHRAGGTAPGQARVPHPARRTPLPSHRTVRVAVLPARLGRGVVPPAQSEPRSADMLARLDAPGAAQLGRTRTPGCVRSGTGRSILRGLAAVARTAGARRRACRAALHRKDQRCAASRWRPSPPRPSPCRDYVVLDAVPACPGGPEHRCR